MDSSQQSKIYQLPLGIGRVGKIMGIVWERIKGGVG